MMSDTSTPPAIPGPEGKTGALVVYLLYLLSIPSVGLFALVGLVVAYALRNSAEGVVRTHIERQIRIGWAWVWWHIAIAVAVVIGVPLMLVLIGFVIVWAAGIVAVLVNVWLAVVSILAGMRLLNDQPA
jgi:uncharacterized membrane protein